MRMPYKEDLACKHDEREERDQCQHRNAQRQVDVVGRCWLLSHLARKPPEIAHKVPSALISLLLDSFSVERCGLCVEAGVWVLDLVLARVRRLYLLFHRVVVT